METAITLGILRAVVLLAVGYLAVRVAWFVLGALWILLISPRLTEEHRMAKKYRRLERLRAKPFSFAAFMGLK